MVPHSQTRECRWIGGLHPVLYIIRDVHLPASCLPWWPLSPRLTFSSFPSMHLLLFHSLLNLKLLTSSYCTGLGRLPCVSGNKSQCCAFVPSCLMCHSALPWHIFTISGQFYHVYVGSACAGTPSLRHLWDRNLVSEHEFYRTIQRSLKCSVHLL